jgi:RNA polymerase sigma-70 factor (ECF subfamily)
METAAQALKPAAGSSPDLSALADQARAGDLDALAALYRQVANPLLAVAYRLLLSRADAEDVVHDLFVGLPEALRHYTERGSLLPWLKRIAARLALSRLRTPARREVRLEEAGPIARPSADPIETMAIEAALASLSPSLRAVLVLKEIEGFSHAEIAAMLGISAGASEVRLHRAVKALRAALSEDR